MKTEGRSSFRVSLIQSFFESFADCDSAFFAALLGLYFRKVRVAVDKDGLYENRAGSRLSDKSEIIPARRIEADLRASVSDSERLRYAFADFVRRPLSRRRAVIIIDLGARAAARVEMNVGDKIPAPGVDRLYSFGEA